jgi:hypothetical protein
MTLWLKVIGTSTSPLRDDWGSHAPPLLRTASFAKRPGRGSFSTGDDFVYYALRGDISRIVALGHIVDEPYFDERRVEDPGWPWLVPIEIVARRDRIADGFPLNLINVGRDLLKSVQQKSHIRLTPEEYAEARRLFGL